MLHENELINIEEDMILNPGYMIRRFTLNNRINGLKVSIINTGPTIQSIKLGSAKDEIIDTSQSNGEGHEWQSHVLGLDTLLLTKNLSQSVMYQLTSDNELILTGKFKAHQQVDWLNPFFFNLNLESSIIDGHLLQIKCDSNGSNSYSDSLLTVSGNIPFDLTGPEPCRLEFFETNGETVYDVTFDCEGNIDTCILATLSYGSKAIEFYLKSNSSSNTTDSNFYYSMRLRIKKHGVSFMPTLMTDFKCIYRFNF